MPATPGSPPKRMTRARAKAVEETKTAPARSNKATASTTTKATASTTAKATAAATTKAATLRNTKRKARTDDEEEQSKAEQQSISAPHQSKSESRKEPAKIVRSSAPARKRTNESSAVKPTSATTSSTAKPSQTRSNKRPGVTTTANVQEHKSSDPPARSTRTRTGSVTSTTVLRATTATKKKVTFQDVDSDKENIGATTAKKAGNPLPRPAQAKDTKSNGVKGEPARTKINKPNTSKGKPNKQGDKTTKTEPLSPKKNVQLSQSASTGSQQMLDDAEQQLGTPIGQAIRSPILIMTPSARQALASTHTGKQPEASRPAEKQDEDLDISIDELQGSSAIFTSPTKSAMPLISSPPKRPTASPFKGALYESPRRFAHGSSQQASQDVATKMTDPALSKPPKRFHLSEPRQKAVFNPSPVLGTGKMLFQSPAKRPHSPSKVLGSTIKAPATASTTRATRVMAGSTLQQTPRRALFSPTKGITSALRAEKSPEASAKVYKMTTEEQARMFEDELVGASSPYSPVKWIQHPTEEKADFNHLPIQDSGILNSTISNEDSLSSPSPVKDAYRRERALASWDPTLCPSPHKDPNVSLLEPRETDISPGFDRFTVEDLGSEDELQDTVQETYYPSPVKATETTSPLRQPSTPKLEDKVTGFAEQPAVSMTVLAEKFGGLQGATPDGQVLQKRRAGNSIFSPPHMIVNESQVLPSIPDTASEALEAELDDSIPILEDDDELLADSPVNYHKDAFRQSRLSEASQDYGDENVMPIDPTLLESAHSPTATCTPARVFEARPKVVHTVCKVPLKPAAEYGESPITKTGRRTHSLTGDLPAHSVFELEAFRQINPSAANFTAKTNFSISTTYQRASRFSEMLTEDAGETVQSTQNICTTPSTKTETWSAATATPARTPRAGLNTRLLSGAVVFVDVHTSEGADASGIFIELLQQMGAKCVKQWSWDSRKSLGSENVAGDLAGFGSTRVGITHVVFKDGGKRTMEKVREAKGLVLCVGVGWVLDCERENKWLDETDYAIDSCTIPRGGNRRRKSMEPKALSNATFAPPKTVQVSPTKEFLNLSSPASRRATIYLPSSSVRQSMLDSSEEQSEVEPLEGPVQDAGYEQTPFQTPLNVKRYEPSAFDSPATPYFLHADQLIQHTCPPKQSQQLLFPVSGRIEDEPDETLRQRLIMARRKSLQWAPKVGSPLARAQSFQ